jgi:methylisocitrate lyase
MGVIPMEKGRSPAARLRTACADRCIAMPGVFNALVAKMAERARFEGMYLSGAALSASAGLADVGLLSMCEVVEQARRITAASSLPLLADAETGFGGPLNVERVVKEFARAGVAAIQLEDQRLPKRCGHLSGKSLISAEEMEQKIRAATTARPDPDFVIVARTDARGVEGFDAAVGRARRYLAAGADMILPEALEDRDEFASFGRALNALLVANMTEFGRSPLLSVRELHELGYRIALFPVTTFRAAMKAAERMLTEISRSGTQSPVLDWMQTRADLYDLLGYDGYEARDRAYFGGSFGADEDTT